MDSVITYLDRDIIAFIRKSWMPLARVALFIVFFYFGALKLFHLSPADPLVAALLAKTIPIIPFESFNIFLGLFEMTIGILFLLPGRAVKVAFLLLVLQMGPTFLPLVLLPEMTWYSFAVPTLEGQYIIKNLVIIALAMGLVASLHSSSPKKNKK